MARALAAQRPPEAIRMGAEVVRIRQDATGVTVHWRDATSGQVHEERAQQLVCTIPFIVLAHRQRLCRGAR